MQVTKASAVQLVIVGAFCMAIHPMLGLGIWGWAWSIHRKHRRGIHAEKDEIRRRVRERHEDIRFSTAQSWLK